MTTLYHYTSSGNNLQAISKIRDLGVVIDTELKFHAHTTTAYMLTRACGYYNEVDSVTDVIFITDGHSNNRENVCTAVNCIPNGANVVSIGVGIDYDGLECIEGKNQASPHIFDVANLEGLLALKNATFDHLITTGKQCKSINK